MPRARAFFPRLFLPFFFFLLLPAGLRAAPAPAPLAGFAHSAWTVDSGAPADIWTLARAPAGYLWLGTGLGLYRFDGLRFDRYPLREGQRLQSTNINALLALPDGDIWLGLFAGGTVRLRDGLASSFGEPEGLPPGRVLRLAQTPDGAIWAAADHGLARFDGRRWHTIAADWAYPEPGADYLLVDRRGRLWVAGRQSLSYLPPGQRRFRTLSAAVSRYAVLAEAPDGRIWVSDALHGIRPLAADAPEMPAGAALPAPPAPAPPEAPRPPRAKQLLFDADGDLWFSEAGVGVRRLRNPGALPDGQRLEPDDGLETFSRHDGLPSEVVVPLLQTAEGDIWAGTNYGLSNFRPQRLHTVTALSGGQRNGFVLAEQDDGVLAAHDDLALLLDPPRAASPQPALRQLRFAVRARDGALWQVGGDGGVWRELRGQRRRYEIPRVGGRVAVLALAPDRRGGAWLSVNGLGVLYAGPDGAVQPQPQLARGRAPPTVIATGPQDEAWFGYDDALLRRAADGAVTQYGAADGLLTGRSTAILSARGGVFVAGEAGFARLEGARFVTISAERDDSFAHVSGIAETADGSLWLNGGRGIVQLLARDLPALFADTPAARLNYRLLNWREGLPGIALQAQPSPTVVLDRRGRLWFATNRGIAWLDPQRLPRNEQPPTLEIQHLRVGDRIHLPGPDLTLAPGTRSIVLRYTALTLSGAERARFRHRLDGVDSDWQDADTRREAAYANLGPGRYRFQVIAANGDGVWSPQGAELAFTIEPTLLQSRPFLAGALLCALALGWLAYRLRARAIAARVRLRLEARHGERERIARELHDTLLQSTQGLIVNVQGLVSQLPAQEPVRGRIEALLDRADEVVLEARERVRDLRATAVGGAQLAERLEATGRELAGEQAEVLFRLVTHGEARALQRAAADELHCLAREALLNAFRHARPRQVEVEIDFGPAELALRVRDDGTGIEPALLERGARVGHWGLAGMRERARQLGGQLHIASRPRAGTEIECRVPAAAAYDHQVGAAPSPRAPTRSGWLARWTRWQT